MKRNVFWEQYIDINQVCHGYQWTDICVRVLAIQWSSKPNSRCTIYYIQWLFFFFLADKNIYNLLLLWTVLKYRNLGEVTEKVRFAIDILSTFLITMLFFLSLENLLLKNSDNCQESTSARTSFWIKMGLSCMLQQYLLKRTLW